MGAPIGEPPSRPAGPPAAGEADRGATGPSGSPDAEAVRAAVAAAARGLSVTGEAFFRNLVLHLAQAIGADYVVAGELLPGDSQVRSLAFCLDGALQENVTYGLAGTPCAGVLSGRTCAWNGGVQEAFPADAMLGDLGAHAYVGTPLRDTAGKPVGLLAALFRRPQPDFATASALLEIFAARAGAELQRQQHERESVAARERLALALWSSDLTFWDWDLRAGRAVVDDRWARMLGFEPDELQPDWSVLVGRAHPEDREHLLRTTREQLAHGPHLDVTYRLQAKDGSWVWVRSRAKVVERDARGEPLRVVGTNRDVTAEKRLEEQLLHSQKMEAVGQLAGGVAHDFNNLLTSILSAAEFAAESLPAGAPALEDIAIVREAGQRAAQLTRQLLAFARRQPLEPQVVDLRASLVATEKLLRRMLGEDVELVVWPDAELWPVRLDPAQFQQVIVNLAVNARAAMPGGGQLTVEAHDATLDAAAAAALDLAPGDYVHVLVTDTGHGMAPEVLERVFEPFFTTREPGKGTGLGLASAYGTVAQAGGQLRAESAPGVGSVFHIYLPRCHETPPAASAPPPAEPGARGGGETVLLVEDDPLVLQVNGRGLQARGYRVLPCRDPEEALARAAEAGPIDLLVTDVVMPRLSGPDLARRVGEARRGLRVLFVSGYSGGRLAGSARRRFLAKPFTPDELAERVREALDGPP
ncbi:PAS domain-containing hybrid sensor histidine kinase/response regulator [Anaeromyxobacter paludicola]|uniref:histidine kinase n=1 Tax=Anaeromyxobacter paludicola TaxID=2918171 RepID=A0ABM7XFK2_9BACT|nr:PAS domain-containing protein [Anaeromyxobacter paludicola]BDG10623.1 hypothetical protein AMPC_37360 [Anaeromyxobacter paludicola]